MQTSHAHELDDTPAVRSAGWKKICRFALLFDSSPLRVRAAYARTRSWLIHTITSTPSPIRPSPDQVLVSPDGTLGGAINFARNAFHSHLCIHTSIFTPSPIRPGTCFTRRHSRRRTQFFAKRLPARSADADARPGLARIVFFVFHCSLLYFILLLYCCIVFYCILF